MAVFRSIVFAAALSGLLVGVFATLARGLGLIAFHRSAVAAVAAILLIAAPHLVGNCSPHVGVW